MSGLEAVAVIGVVAALVTAFKDSSSIANAIKQRRKQKEGSLPPTVELEEVLHEGEHEIQKAAAAGIRRFGPAFVEEDVEAKLALQTIVIEVQASMLRDLSHAVQDDSITDFTDIIEASTEARMKAVNILTGLYLRRKSQAAVSSVPDQSLRVPETTPRVSEQSQSQSPPQPKSQPIPVPSRSQGHPLPQELKENEDKQRKSRSWSSKLSWMTTSYVDEQRSKQLRRPPTEQSRISPSQYEPSTTSTFERTPPPYQLTRAESRSNPYNPWADAFSINDSDSRKSMHSLQSPILTRQDSRLSVQGVVTISPENKYGGFCEGAYHLQVSLPKKALKRKNASVSMTGQHHYFACMNSRCVFEGPAVPRSGGWSYDKTIHSAPGLQYTWLFLAKSHVPQTRVKKRVFDFKCIFCTLLGDQSAVFHGKNSLLEHVAGHAGTQLTGLPLSGPLFVSNNAVMQAGDSNFDINVMAEHAPSISEPFPSSPLSRELSSDSSSLDDVWRDPDDGGSIFRPNWR